MEENGNANADGNDKSSTSKRIRYTRAFLYFSVPLHLYLSYMCLYVPS